MSMRSAPRWVFGLVVLTLAVSACGGAGQGADPGCGDTSGATYVDCGNGTVTDNRTGLVWLANADCFGNVAGHDLAMRWAATLADVPADLCASQGLTPDECDCGLSDGSVPGDWRLPSAGEWQAMVADADGDPPGELDCSPTITTDDGSQCYFAGCELGSPPLCSFRELENTWYLSSSTNAHSPFALVWGAALTTGVVQIGPASHPGRLWAVRDGQ